MLHESLKQIHSNPALWFILAPVLQRTGNLFTDSTKCTRSRLVLFSEIARAKHVSNPMYFPHFVSDFTLKLERITKILCIVLSTCLSLSLSACLSACLSIVSQQQSQISSDRAQHATKSCNFQKFVVKIKLLLTHCTLLLKNHSSCVSLVAHHDESYERHAWCDT